MKKLFSFIVIMMILITVAGCSEPKETTGNYTIDIYTENIEDDQYSLYYTDSGVAEIGSIQSIESTLIGFVLNENLSILSGTVSGDTDLYIQAIFDRLEYKFTLMDSIYKLSTYTYKYDAVPAQVDDLTKMGNVFLGWTTTMTGTDYYTFDEPITDDVTLYAQWTGNNNDTYIYEGYYEGAEGLYETTLESFLKTVVTTGFTGVDYGDARYILDETDRDPNNSSNVILMYLNTSVSGVWDAGATWNREHVWPQSLLGVSASNSTTNQASDLHNLKPADPGTNSSRSNKYFDNTTTSVSYAPRDAVKGDIARILFYMDVRYANLNLINGTPTVYQMAMLNTLLQWNELDPVDSFEQNRNEVIFSYQHNRNPFIDHPEFAYKIWGTVTTTSQSDSFLLSVQTNTYLWMNSFIQMENVSQTSYRN